MLFIQLMQKRCTVPINLINPLLKLQKRCTVNKKQTQFSQTLQDLIWPDSGKSLGIAFSFFGQYSVFATLAMGLLKILGQYNAFADIRLKTLQCANIFNEPIAKVAKTLYCPKKTKTQSPETFQSQAISDPEESVRIVFLFFGTVQRFCNFSNG